ncbi:PKD domain-containing protein [Litoribacter populi]|uniref:PKD domain-containing protein n=1 Tax=Litoribacter populi TaxID=2598460 RepID=UPI00117C2CD4|nr:PKD domain-containing protein [Litoribacter populi]
MARAILIFLLFFVVEKSLGLALPPIENFNREGWADFEVDFSLDYYDGCAPFFFVATDETAPTCPVQYFEWSAAYVEGSCGPGPDWEFIHGRDSRSNPTHFHLINSGKYEITLTYYTECGTFTKTKLARSISSPTSEVLGITDLCGPGEIFPYAEVTDCEGEDIWYIWSFEGGSPSYSYDAYPGPIFYDTPGEYNITLLISNICGTKMSHAIQKVNPLPEIIVGEPLETCPYDPITINPEIYPANGNYKFLWTSDNEEYLSDADSRNITVNPQITTSYFFKLIDLDINCYVEEEFIIEVKQLPVIDVSIPDQVICSEGYMEMVNFIPSVPGDLSWRLVSGNIADVQQDGASEIPAQVLTHQSDWPVELVFEASLVPYDSETCIPEPVNYTVTVLPKPRVTHQNFIICSGESVSFEPSEHLEGALFNWRVQEDEGLQGVTVPQDFRPFHQTLSHEGTEPKSIVYSAIPLLDICEGDEFLITITVLPKPRITPSLADQEICSGNFMEGVFFASQLEGTEFVWRANAAAAGIGGLVSEGIGDMPAQMLTNNSPHPIDVVFEIIGQTSGENSCDSDPIFHRVTVTPPLEINENISDYNGYGVSCSGMEDGWISIRITGGSGDYQYSWTGPEGFSSDELEINGLKSGIYELSVEDQAGCINVSSFELKAPEALQLHLIDYTELICYERGTGSIEVEASGGAGGYEYVWTKNGNVLPDTGRLLVGQGRGDYNVEVYDANGCFGVLDVDLKINETPSLEVSWERSTQISCEPRLINEIIELKIDGGVPPYSIEWSGGIISNNGYSFSSSLSGEYTFQVSDAKGCMVSQIFSVEEFTVTMDIGIESAEFDLYQSFLINKQINFVNQSNGPIVEFYWDFGDGSVSFEENPTHTYTAEGQYTITLIVTDKYGCQTVQKQVIEVWDYYLVIPEAFTPNGDGLNDYFFPKFLYFKTIEFWVQNKWGELVFHTTKLDSPGWDGFTKGQLAIPGNYVYKLRFTTLDDREVTKTGVFLLLK